MHRRLATDTAQSPCREFFTYIIDDDRRSCLEADGTVRERSQSVAFVASLFSNSDIDGDRDRRLLQRVSIVHEVWREQ